CLFSRWFFVDVVLVLASATLNGNGHDLSPKVGPIDTRCTTGPGRHSVNYEVLTQAPAPGQKIEMDAGILIIGGKDRNTINNDGEHPSSRTLPRRGDCFGNMHLGGKGGRG